MTCSRESSERWGADCLGAGFVPMRDAIIRNRALDFSARLARADSSRDRVRDRNRIEARAGDRAIVPVTLAAGRRRKLGRDRYPGRPFEDVLQRRFLLLDDYGEVRFGQIEREAGRRFEQAFPDPLERVGVIGQLGMRQPCTAGQHTRQHKRDTHSISTIAPCLWPVEDEQ